MDPTVLALLSLIGVVGIFFLLRFRRTGGRSATPIFENEREEQLTKRVAAQVKCSLGAALESVRQELGYSPGQSDDVLVKRAVYHYNQAHPAEHKVTYCDRIRG